MKLVHIIIVIAATLLGASCEVINPEEGIPSYIQIDTVQFNSNIEQGTERHGILDSWVIINDNLLGIYQIPFEIPILESGPMEIKIRSGVKVNGQNEIRKDYPFYTTYSEVVHLVPGETVTIEPEIGYFNDTEMWIEAFEDPGFKFVESSGSDSNMIRTIDSLEVFEGNASGKLVVDQVNKHVIVKTEENFMLPNSQPVFLELHYNCDISFSVGVFAEGLSSVTKVNILTLVSTQGKYPENWNKLYLDMSTIINATPGTPLNLFFEAVTPESSQMGTVLLDNIKLIYPQ